MASAAEIKVGQLPIAIDKHPGLQEPMTLGVAQASGSSLPVQSNVARQGSCTILAPINPVAPISPETPGQYRTAIKERLLG